MKLEKRGLIFSPNSKHSWWKTHVLAPCALALNDEVIRVYFGGRDVEGVSRISYMDVDAKDPSKVIYVADKPVLDIGKPGTFDENGVFPASVIKIGNKIYLYYTGVQLGVKVRYYMFCGLAVSDDGENFARVSEAPVLDRADEGLITRSGITVLPENSIFKTWYSSGNTWEFVGNEMRPTYSIYYAESPDGINYPSKGTLCIPFDASTEHGLGRPQVIKKNNFYYLFFTIRTKNMKYTSGAAISEDGVAWKRIKLDLYHSDNGWDSQMVYFPSVVNTKYGDYLFYCGNEYGKTGYGFAQIIEW